MSGYIGYRKVPTISNGSGIWPINEQAKFKKDGVWPLADPYFASVSLLLHFDGANNSTTFTDYSLSPKTVTRYGDAKISTAQSKFDGLSSGLFDGSGDYLTAGTSSDFNFGTGDFTIEAWIYTASQSLAYSCIFANGHSSWSSTPDNVFFMNYGTTASPGNQRKIGFGTPQKNPILLGTTLLNTGQWYHVAVSRQGNTFRLFVGGAVEATDTYTLAIDLSASGLNIGRTPWDGADSYWNGYLQEVRLTKGVARYTTDFTPPTVPFPNN